VLHAQLHRPSHLVANTSDGDWFRRSRSPMAGSAGLQPAHASAGRALQDLIVLAPRARANGLGRSE
jgi:hypothetical protein